MRYIFKNIFFLIISILFLVIMINVFVLSSTSKYIYSNKLKVPSSDTALILGASVHANGKLSPILFDRAKNGALLYRNGKVKNVLLSGDHGKKYYDEVTAMKHFFLKEGISKKTIFLDFNGVNTYYSIKHAARNFNVKKMIIVTQEFHLPRAIFIAKKMNIEVYGFVADNRKYKDIYYYRYRECLARVKSFFQVYFNLLLKDFF